MVKLRKLLLGIFFMFAFVSINNVSYSQEEDSTKTCECVIKFINNTEWVVMISLGEAGNVSIDPNSSYEKVITGNECYPTTAFLNGIYYGKGSDICPCDGSQSYTIN